MKNKGQSSAQVTRSFLAALLMVVLLLGMVGSVFAATGERIRNPGKRNEVCTELSAQAQAYYTGSDTYENLIKLSGAADNTDSYAATQNNELYTALTGIICALSAHR